MFLESEFQIWPKALWDHVSSAPRKKKCSRSRRCNLHHIGWEWIWSLSTGLPPRHQKTQKKNWIVQKINPDCRPYNLALVTYHFALAFPLPLDLRFSPPSNSSGKFLWRFTSNIGYIRWIRVVAHNTTTLSLSCFLSLSLSLSLNLCTNMCEYIYIHIYILCIYSIFLFITESFNIIYIYIYIIYAYDTASYKCI